MLAAAVPVSGATRAKVAKTLTYNNPLAAACGKTANGFTAAMNQLTFGAPPGLGAGDACGRCFKVTGTSDPYSPSYTGPFFSIVVKNTDLCPVAGNQQWCGQTVGNPTNQYGQPVQCVVVSLFSGCQSAEIFFVL